MSNPYYTFTSPLTPGTRGRAGELNDQFRLLEAAFDAIPAVGSAPFAAPTVKVGLGAADQGVLNFALRSDAKLVLDETIAPTWTGAHTFNVSPVISSTAPFVRYIETDGALNEKRWIHGVFGGQFILSSELDSGGGGANAIIVDRTGTTIDLIALTSTALTWNASAVLTAASGAQLSASNTFTGLIGGTSAPVMLVSTKPGWLLTETDAAADNKHWRFYAEAERLVFDAINDANSIATNWLAVDRTGAVIDSIALTSTALTWNSNSVLTTATGAQLAGANTFTANQTISSTAPSLLLEETDAAANEHLWQIRANAGQLFFNALNDLSAATPWLTVDRTGAVVDSIALASTAFTWNASAVLTAATGAQLSAANTFANLQMVSGTSAFLRFQETDGSTNEKVWQVGANADGFFMTTLTDAFGAGADFMAVQRTGTTVTSIDFGATALTWNSNTVLTTATGAQISSGSASPTISSGLTTTPTVSINWTRTGDLVHVLVSGGATGTSNSTAMTLGLLPSGIRPSGARRAVSFGGVDNGNSGVLMQVQVASSGLVTLLIVRSDLYAGRAQASANWTNTGTKGVDTDLAFFYTI